MRILAVIFLLTGMLLPLLSAEEYLSSKSFLEKARNPVGKNYWVTMEGKAIHRRRDKDNSESPIYVALRMFPDRTAAQVIINGNEGYLLGQKYEPGPESTSVIAMEPKPAKSKLAEFGLRPQDLTMAFMFWDFDKELSSERIKGYECRVLKLNSPSKDEYIHVYINSEYYFPLKVEWFRKSEDKPYRTGEFGSFRKHGDFWLVSSLLIYGPGWKTRIDFDKTAADFSDKSIPAELFRKIEGEAGK
ncbi:MAG: hypothetical protein A2020_14185 [Lentisphaerae bacterium GWF2_45_14]|nr:MAG: hypothetical protein A2020_14185 [Lentisphaerae bacterium GWF2_45_14]